VSLRLGTRGSDLARTQSLTIAANLANLGWPTELTVIQTAGDRSSAASFGAIGPQGVFVREIEERLLAGDIDLAVHSFKDLPTRSPDELVVGAVPERHDPADLLLIRPDAWQAHAEDLLPLAPGARVGTASARRRAWLAHFRPDLGIESLRGNVPTRIRRLGEGAYDAIVLAAAGVERLRADTGVLDGALARLVTLRLDPARFVPAPAQGALAVQCRRDRADILAALAKLDHAPSRVAVEAERVALARAEGGCEVAFGAHCAALGAGFELTAMLERGGEMLIGRARGADAGHVAAAAWAALTATPARGAAAR
jgi:hydroxymethylbilane synthase